MTVTFALGPLPSYSSADADPTLSNKGGRAACPNLSNNGGRLSNNPVDF